MAEVNLDVSVQGSVAWVVFERPGVLNALAPADLPRLADALRDAGSAEGVRAVVVQGGGGTFSSGDDLRATAELEPDSWRDVVEGFHDLTRVARGLDVPVICAIDVNDCVSPSTVPCSSRDVFCVIMLVSVGRTRPPSASTVVLSNSQATECVKARREYPTT